MDLITTCHVEYGRTDDKKIIFDKREPIGALAGVYNSMELADKNDVNVCYMFMPEVAFKHPQIVKEVAEAGHEVGLHLHPDDTYLWDNGLAQRKVKALRDWNYRELKHLIHSLRTLFLLEFGVALKSFSGGKWSINEDAYTVLHEEGFHCDLTMNTGYESEFMCWRTKPRIRLPHKIHEDLIEIPYSKIFRNRLASPEEAQYVGLPWLKAGFTEHYTQNLPLFHIVFHSVSMTSPYYRRIFDEYLTFIRKHDGIVPILPRNYRISSRRYTPRTRLTPYLKAINGDLIRYCMKKWLP